ncbi:MAG TPA: hypothetical protein VMO47_06650 [Rhodothermales bacterium]|nr:hypothetical protein [Rhodothermales bacterium]
MRNLLATLAMFSVLVFSNLPAVAQAPALLSFQGSLDFKGVAPDTMLSLTFRLLDDTTASPTIVWSEVQPNVLVENGIFNVILGSVTPLESLEFYRQLWLEIQDNGDGSTFRYPTQLTATPYAMSLVFPQVHNVSAGGTAFWINNGDADAIRGETHAQTGHGLGGYGSSFVGTNRGVYGFSASDEGTGVYGLANTTLTSHPNYGVFGKSNSNTGFGVYGTAPKTGVYGTATADAVDAYGVYGMTSGSGLAVYGLSTGSGRGVFGHNSGTGRAGHFEINNASNSSEALFAYTNGTGNAGYFQIAFSGSSENVIEATTSGSGYGLNAEGGAIGVRATASSILGVGVSGETAAGAGIGVRGLATAGSSITYGVYGDSDSPDGYGVRGTGGKYGVYGSASENGAFGDPTAGIYGVGVGKGVYNYAGVFDGYVLIRDELHVEGGATFEDNVFMYNDLIIDDNVDINGNLDVAGTKNFRIDHPLDPANKYLYHFAMESSEVLNLYSGNVITDREGRASVTLPEWFDEINKDFRYQLTVVGTFARAIISEEIDGNRFSIRTDKPYVKVSWQVTGIRNDLRMREYPPQVERLKPEDERGTYLTEE